MVSSAHPLATLAGVRTLMEGGNAIDAAVAVASCVGATEIGLSGIGGVGWMQIYSAKTNEHICLDYQGWSPYAAESRCIRRSGADAAWAAVSHGPGVARRLDRRA